VILRPIKPSISFKQIALDSCIEEPYVKLREGKHADEIVELGGEIIIVEKAEKPDARDAQQALHTLRRALGLKLKVKAVVIVAEKGYSEVDYALITQALRTECFKHGLHDPLLKRRGSKFRVQNMLFEARDC